MSGFSMIMVTALTLVFSENILFCRALGSDVLLRTAVQPRQFMKMGLLVTVFTVLSSVLGWAIDLGINALKIQMNLNSMLNRAQAYLVGLTLLYLISDGVLRVYFPKFFAGIAEALPISIFNTAVLGTPLLLARINETLFSGTATGGLLFSALIGLAVGVGFMLAVLLMAEGIRQLEAMDIPAAFSGLPARLLYVAMLAMAFSAFSGHQAGI